jgi:phage-related protein
MRRATPRIMQIPRQARREMGYQLENVQEGVDPDDWKPMTQCCSVVLRGANCNGRHAVSC